MLDSTRLVLVLFVFFCVAAVAPAADCGVVTAETGLPGVVPGLEAPGPVDLAPVEGPEVSEKECTAFVHCSDGSSVSCVGSGTTCRDTPANCPFERGSVKCGNTIKFCPECSGDYYCNQGAACGLMVRSLCGAQGTHPGVCYQGSCRCWCVEGTSCSTNSDCGPPNTGGVCFQGACYCQ